MKPLSPNFPFSPARAPFFYGWVIVFAATLGIAMSIPGQTMGVSVFTDHLIEVTGLSRLELTYTYLAGTLGSSLLLPLGGAFLDRNGARWTGLASCLAVAMTLIMLTQIETISTSLASVMGASGSVGAAAAVLTLGFLALRFSGQGMLTMASRTMMVKWFEHRRGIVSGISGVFVSGSFAIAPLALQGLIDVGGWQGAWWMLAGFVGIGMSLVVFILFRENPEECGLRMDGQEHDMAIDSAETSPPISPAIKELAFTRGEAIRTARFWYVTLALALQAMVFTGVTFHIVDLGIDTGLGGREAVRLFIPIALVSTSMGMISGWAADRVSVRALSLSILFLQTLGFIGASRLGETPFMLLMILGWGTGGGLFGTLINVATPNFFGRLHLGAISSIQMSCIVAGSALGPALLAASKTYLGSYRQGLEGCCLLSVAVFLFTLFSASPPNTTLSERVVGQAPRS